MITSKTIALGIIKAVVVLLLASLLLLLIYKIKAVFLYLVLSLIFTLIANPIVEWLKRRLKFSNILAVLTTMLFFILIMVGLVMLFVPLIISQSNNLSLLNTTVIQQNILELINQANEFLESHNIEGLKPLNSNYLLSKINLDLFTNFFNSILTTISNLGIGIASVFFITFFFLKDKIKFIYTAKQFLPDNHEGKILNSLSQINVLLSRYFIGLLLQLFIIFVLYLIVLLIFGIENALIIAFLCAILNIIPYIGPLISSVIAAFLTMMNHLGADFQTEILPSTIYVLIGFMIVQFIDNNFSQPLIFSNSIKSHPLEIFLVILISGFLVGIAGMILAIPIYTIVKVIGKEFFPDNKIIKVLTKNI